MTSLRIAIPKGKNKLANKVLNKAGIPIPGNIDDSRKYIVESEDGIYEFILVKPIDIPTVVEFGMADIAIVSKDVLLENQRDVHELLDLKTSLGRVSVFGIDDIGYSQKMNLRIATNLPNITAKYFKEKGKQVEIIKLNGYLEQALEIGLSDYTVELVELNHITPLNELDFICNISDRLIANKKSYYVKDKLIQSVNCALEHEV